MLPLKYPRRWQLASLLLLAGVLVFAQIPSFWFFSGDMPGDWEHPDKVLHVLTFIVLALWFCGQYARSKYWVIATGLTIFGVLIEALQYMIPYRSAQTGDLMADIAGIVCGMVIALLGLGGWSLRIEQWYQKRTT